MASCRLCHMKSEIISEGLGGCLDCIRKRPNEALVISALAHAKSRKAFSFPAISPHLKQLTAGLEGYKK